MSKSLKINTKYFNLFEKKDAKYSIFTWAFSRKAIGIPKKTIYMNKYLVNSSTQRKENEKKYLNKTDIITIIHIAKKEEMANKSFKLFSQ